MKKATKGSASSDLKKDVTMGVADNLSGVKKKRSVKKSRGTKKGQRQRKPKLTSSDLTKPIEISGDSLHDVNVGLASEDPVKSSETPSEMMLVENVNDTSGEDASQKKKKPNKGKLKNIKSREKRRIIYEQQRGVVDNLIRSAPHRVMWEWYKMQAGEQLPLSERLSKQWTPDQVNVVEDGSERSLIPHIKRIVGDDYAVNTRKGSADNQKQEPEKRKAAAVACLAIGYDSESAVRLARRVFDGTPVIKLFSRHMEMDEQRKMLRKIPHGFSSAMSGTAKRIHDLVNDGALTLEHTKVVVIDLCRSSMLSNLLEVSSTSRELFALFHDHVRQFLEGEHLNIILVTQTEEEMPKERFAPQKSNNDQADMDDVPNNSDADDATEE